MLLSGIPTLNQFFESLELRRNPGSEHRRLLVEQMRVRCSHRNLDWTISRPIVKGHGGTMEASNNKDGGATFAFTLPTHQGGPS